MLIESSAICMYLADRYGGGRLAPATGTVARGKYYDWTVYIPATVDPLLETIMFHTIFLPEDKRLPHLSDRAKKTWATKVEPRFVATLSNTPFILGDAFTAADVLAASTLGWARMAGVLGEAPALARYLHAIASRSAFLASNA